MLRNIAWTLGLALAGFAAWTHARAGAGRAPAWLAVDAAPLRSLAGQGASYEDILARARAAGVSALLLKPLSLEGWLDSIGASRFSSEEARRVRGIVPEAGLPAGPSIWISSRADAERLLEKLGEHGVSFAYTESRGRHVVELADDFALAGLPMGFDPSALSAARAAGLVPLLSARTPSDWPREGGTGMLLLWERGLAAPAPSWAQAASRQGGVPRVALLSESPEGGAARSGRRAWGRLLGEGRFLNAAILDARAGLGEARRLSARGGLILAGLEPAAGVEDNFKRLRALSRLARAPGEGLLAEREGRILPGAELLLRWASAFLLCALGPLAALRAGLALARRLRKAAWLAEASPGREVLLGGALAWALAAALAACVGALLAPPSWGLGFFPFGLGAWPLGAALALCALAVYGPAASSAGPARPWAAALCLAALWLPPLPAWGRSALECFPSMWWAGERWRELWIGFPCLWLGVWGYVRSLGRERRGDPRLALLLSILALSDMIQAGARPEGFLESLRQSALAALGGLALFLLGSGAWLLARRGWGRR